ncbi:MAG: pantoate--beta-alanine ligase [Microthrixaceae bacterium]
MLTLTTIEALRSALAERRSQGATVGLVPTMGYLHSGHQGLCRAAAGECDEVVTTIFVNPLQFAEGEDLDRYPRDPDGDALKAAEAGTTILFTPEPTEMYPEGPGAVATSVTVAELAARMEGAARPTHFAGVCTVVAKLFNIVGPCRAYFGEKDFQQLAIVTRMAEDLSFPVTVMGCPTAREPDGLAMSSRNVYLSEQERATAPILQRALLHGAQLVGAGMADTAEVLASMSAMIDDAALGELDYLEVVDPRSLVPVERIEGPVRLLGAVRFGAVRLIDNVAASRPGDV